MNFDEAVEKLKTAKVPLNGKPYGANTRILAKGNDIVIRLYNTDIVTFKQDNTIVLNSGGYRTPTTKDRMNVVLDGLGVYQDKGLWYVGTGFHDLNCLFFDGIVLKDGKILNPKSPLDMEDAKKRVDILVKRYINGYVAHITQNGMDRDRMGDCFACSMKATDGRMEPMGVDHYFSHFEERYFVPSILINAMIEKKYGDMNIVWGMMLGNLKFREIEARSALGRFFKVRKLALAEEELMRHDNNKTTLATQDD